MKWVESSIWVSRTVMWYGKWMNPSRVLWCGSAVGVAQKQANYAALRSAWYDGVL